MTARSIAVVILRADFFFLASDPIRGRLIFLIPHCVLLLSIAAAPADAARLRQPLQRIAQVLSTLIEASSTSARRDS